MIPIATFTVIGIPAPQGSKTAVSIGGRARLIEGSSKTGREKHKSWREGVRVAATDWLRENPRPPIDEPVMMMAEFAFPLTASDPYRTRHTVKPDLSKILRSTEDAIVDAGLLRDDSLIFSVTVTKHYTVGDQSPGVVVSIMGYGDREAADRKRLKDAAAARRKVERLTK